jgi:hypothetical protein
MGSAAMNSQWKKAVFMVYSFIWLITVAMQSKLQSVTHQMSHSLFSNPTWGMDIIFVSFLLWVEASEWVIPIHEACQVCKDA